MRRSLLRLYGPFIALAVVQALIIVAAPSKAPSRVSVAAGANGFKSGGSAAAAGGSTSGVAGGGSTAAGGTSAGGASGTAGAADGSGGGGGGTATNVNGLPPGDTSHCAGNYQFDILIEHGPPCQPAFAGDNGGATYDGVTADTIKVIYFESQPNEQVNQILAVKGLATSSEEEDAAIKVFTDFINSHYELYGRKIDVQKVIGDCPTTPPDYNKCEIAAQEVVKQHPFAVIWVTSLYADVFDIWANAGIVTLGGSSFDKSYYNDRRPYRYDVTMDGTQAGDYIADYYCSKMAHGTADHAGTVIHPTIGGRNTPRKLGVIVPEIPADVKTAQHVIDEVKACGGTAADQPFTYKSDINAATTQTEATVAALINQKVTTVVCMCDPIAPVFATNGMTNQGYFPEHLLPDLGLLDYDLLGQLYNPQQWVHAFGPSQLGNPTNLDDSNPARVWRAMGQQGHPCGNNGCGLPWAYLGAMASMLQQTGPNLNPLTFEQGVLTNLPPVGGSGPTPLVNFGPGDYTGVGDVREVWWNPNKTTPTDGSKGAYETVGGDLRHQLGSFSNNLNDIPVASQ